MGKLVMQQFVSADGFAANEEECERSYREGEQPLLAAPANSPSATCNRSGSAAASVPAATDATSSTTTFSTAIPPARLDFDRRTPSGSGRGRRTAVSPAAGAAERTPALACPRAPSWSRPRSPLFTAPLPRGTKRVHQDHHGGVRADTRRIHERSHLQGYRARASSPVYALSPPRALS